MTHPTLGELTASCLKIGLLGFGGPAGQIALMHREFVDTKAWIDEARYLHALNFCMLLPGPEAQQLATYVGWMLHGVRGGVIAGLLFVLPGALVVTALAWIYAAYGATQEVSALFYGVKAAVLALVAEALFRIGRRALKGAASAAISAGAFLALFAVGLPFPLVIVAAAVWGAIAGRDGGGVVSGAEHGAGAVQLSKSVGSALVWLLVWLLPLAALAVLFGREALLVRIGELFSLLATVSFGGAYAVLAYLQQEAVGAQGWLTTTQMIDGLGLAETTPGPLVLVNVFVGFLAGWQAEGGGAALALAGGLVAAWCTFAPSFVWIFAGAPYAEALRHSPRASGALSAVTAAVLGVIANLAVWFALHVIFADQAQWTAPWGHALVGPVWSSLDPIALLLAVAAAVALMVLRVPVLLVVLGAALAGLAARAIV